MHRGAVNCARVLAPWTPALLTMLAPLVTIGLCGLLSTAAHGGDDDGRRTGAKPPPPCPCDDPSLCRPLSPQPSADRDEVVAFSSWTFNGEPNRHNYTAPQHFDWSKITTWAPFEVDETGPDGDQYAEMFCTCLRDTCLPDCCLHLFNAYDRQSHEALPDGQARLTGMERASSAGAACHRATQPQAQTGYLWRDAAAGSQSFMAGRCELQP